jgi:16S rRNA (cytidine1402-2'-O)-methyltransferase
MKGSIYLVPNTLGEDNFEYILPPDVIKIVDSINYFVVENEKTARRFIKRLLPEKNQSEFQIEVLDKNTDPMDIPGFLNPANKGHNIGIISEAGVPCVADPGADLVAIAHRRGITVRPLIGPSSILLALMASGFNGQSFAFRGYLPHDQMARKRAFQNMEREIRNGQTQIFMDTPYRNEKLLKELISILHPETKICLATDITLESESIQTKTAAQWSKEVPNINKRPTIFLID